MPCASLMIPDSVGVNPRISPHLPQPLTCTSCASEHQCHSTHLSHIAGNPRLLLRGWLPH